MVFDDSADYRTIICVKENIGEKLLGSLGGMFSKIWKPTKNHPIMGLVITIGLTEEERLGFLLGKAFSCCLLYSSVGFLAEVSPGNHSFVTVCKRHAVVFDDMLRGKIMWLSL
ncbi:hypothetical protein SADUNF_Sadunf15G0046400 [Salix dunnii]|uniref:Uncharacterized protein n=1 Tax=Salix dunnii TaxID=1413687 RepID=A0A835MNM4_9ROSI|nr:hypothetical protein SADUNF_Sadunf15G0046400 [Salix dunnii]